MARKQKTFDYDVCFSFAGEQREYVERVAALLKKAGIRVFIDADEQVKLWGKDLFVAFDSIYKDSAKYCVIFASKEYAKKAWTNHERRSAQERSISSHSEYILPATFDGTRVPGFSGMHTFDLRTKTPAQFAKVIREKIAIKPPAFPQHPDKLFSEMEATSPSKQELILEHANSFNRALQLMTEEERRAVFLVFRCCCPSELPDNIHIESDLLSRISGIPVATLSRIFKKMSSLGFFFDHRFDHEHDSDLFYLEFHNRGIDHGGNATDVANAMVKLIGGCYCDEHALDALLRLDFSSLATKKASAVQK